jgi:hypothetical protein
VLPWRALHLQAELRLRLQALRVLRGIQMTGWHGAPFVPADGQHWPLSIAATMLDLPEQDLRDLVRIVEAVRGESLASGTIRMNAFSRQGRQPRAYPAVKLIAICEGIRSLAEGL